MGPRSRVDSFLADEAAGRGSGFTGCRVAGVGWATVDLDRAAAELLTGDRDHDPAASGDGDGRWSGVAEPTTDDRALGARCRGARIAGPDDQPITLVLLEPSTEGRLAATLARYDEGPAAVWLAAEDPASLVAGLCAAGTDLTSRQDGPLGPERLVVGGPPGLHRLVLVAPDTI